MITIDPTNDEQHDCIEDLYRKICNLRYEFMAYRAIYGSKKEIAEYAGAHIWRADFQESMTRVQFALQEVNTILKSLGFDEITIQYPTDAAPEIATSDLI